ncbi:hypothetical protein IW136_002430 [Coemansia sp. RSA 678]|nr:hypothetical protein IW136_002430 [Coemansia sp. RSA 678]
MYTARILQRHVRLAQPTAVRAFHIKPASRYKLTDQSDMQQIDTQVGTVSPHRHHLVVCNSSPEKWPSRIEGMSETVTALARGSIRLPGRAMVTMSDFAPLNSTSCGCASQNTKDDKYERIDVAVFPLGLVAKQLDVAGVNKLLEWLGYDILPTSWTPTHANLPQPEFDHSWLELTQNRHIFVCTHGSRDYLCGLHGGKLLKDVRSLIEQRNLQKHIGAWATSHIGGHKYAANAIVYPRGDWYGTWCDKCNTSAEPERRDDAQAIVDAVVHDVTWWDAWRGATNMSKQDQIAMWTRSADHADNAGHAESDEFSWSEELSEPEELSESLELSLLESESESESLELPLFGSVSISMRSSSDLTFGSLSFLMLLLSLLDSLSESELSLSELESESLLELLELLELELLESESLSLEPELSESESLSLESELELLELELLESESLSLESELLLLELSSEPESESLELELSESEDESSLLHKHRV